MVFSLFTLNFEVFKLNINFHGQIIFQQCSIIFMRRGFKPRDEIKNIFPGTSESILVNIGAQIHSSSIK